MHSTALKIVRMKLIYTLFLVILLVGINDPTNAQTQTQKEEQNKREQENQNVQGGATNNSVNSPSPLMDLKLEESVDANKKKSIEIKTHLPIPQPADPASWKQFYLQKHKSKLVKTNKNFSEGDQKELDEIVGEMGKFHQESFEFLLLKYINGRYDRSNAKYLLRAHDADPGNAEAWPYLVAHYEMTGDATNRKKYAAMLTSGGLFGEVSWQWHKDLLNSLDANAVLVTNGYMDTYPAWALQAKNGLRTDVTIVFLDLIHDKVYRTELGKTLGLQLTGSEPDEFVAEMIKLKTKTLYLSSGLDKTILKQHEGQLKMNGLAFRIRGDESTMLKQFWEKHVNQKALKTTWGTGDENQLKRNYLPALIKLYRIYKNAGNDKQAAEVKDAADTIAAKLGMTSQIEGYFKD